MIQHTIFKYCSKLLFFLIVAIHSSYSQDQTCPFDGIYFNPDSIKKTDGVSAVKVIKAKTRYICKYQKRDVEVTNRLCNSFGVQLSFDINRSENGDLIAKELCSIFLNQKDFAFYTKHLPANFIADFSKDSANSKNFELPTKKYDTFHVSLKRQSNETIHVVIDLYLT